MEAEQWAAMSGSNVMCVTTVLLETGIVPMKEPVTNLILDTAAGLVSVRAACEQGRCRSVEIDSVPAFVVGLDY